VNQLLELLVSDAESDPGEVPFNGNFILVKLGFRTVMKRAERNRLRHISSGLFSTEGLRYAGDAAHRNVNPVVVHDAAGLIANLEI
jgi:hypothetical protein